MNLTASQYDIIERQLGRKPRGIVKIAAQSSSGIPLVLQIRSWLDGEPFPTLYWLCSKDLHKAISHIEAHGGVKALEQEILEDEILRQRLMADQERYRDQRFKLMSAEDKQAISKQGFTELFEGFGIGGIRTWDKIRCLHMHYAHHLAEANVIGQLLDQRFQLNELKINH
ncbi:MAG: DUF501 domain-containing protein [Pseudomonadales bacterium]|nr:DUF501 domain-containing protein [Pseudomonadales bacterium]